MAVEYDKKVFKVRGTSTIDRETGSVEFRPAQPGDPVQRNVKKFGKSSFYETEGEKTSSYVCHLKVDKDCEDPAAEMQEQLDRLTSSIRKKEPATPRGKFLMNRDDVVVVHSSKNNSVSVRLTIDLSTEGEVSSKLFNLISEVNKCFVINQKRLRPVT